MRRILRFAMGLAMVHAALCGARGAITFTPFQATGAGGSRNGQTVRIGSGASTGTLYEVDAFLFVRDRDLNGTNAGAVATLSSDSLPTGLTYRFSASVSADGTDMDLVYQFINTGTGTYSDVRFFSFVDAEIDQAVNTFFNEYGASTGTLGSGSADASPDMWQIDEPGFVNGDLIDKVLLGTLGNSNAIPASAPDDVALGLGFVLGDIVLGQISTVTIRLSQDGDPVGGFGLAHRDNDPGSPLVITVSGQSATRLRVLTNLVITGAAALDEGSGETYSATAYFHDTTGSNLTQDVTTAAVWSVVGGLPPGTALAANRLNAGPVSSNTPVVIRAAYTYGGMTQSDEMGVTIRDTRALTNLVAAGPAVLTEMSTGTYSAVAYFTDFESNEYTADVSLLAAWSLASAAPAGTGMTGNRLAAGPVNADTPVVALAIYSYRGVTMTDDVAVTILDTRILTNLVVTGSPAVNEGVSASYVATAYFADAGGGGLCETVTATAAWSLPGAVPAGTALTGGVLTAGAVTSDVPVTVQAVYAYRAVTETGSVVVAIRDTRVLTNLVCTGALRMPECSSSTCTGTAHFADFGPLARVLDVSTSATWRLAGPAPAGTTLTGARLTAGAVATNTMVVVEVSYAAGSVGRTNALAVMIEDRRMLTNLVVTGAAQVNEGASSDCTSTAFFADCGPLPLTENVTAAATWSLVGAAPAGTTIAAGVLTAGAVVSNTPVTVRAAYRFGGATLTSDRVVTIVDTRVLTNLVCTGALRVPECSPAAYTGTAYFADFGPLDRVTDVSASATWRLVGAIPAGTTLAGRTLTAGAVATNATVVVEVSYAAGGVAKTNALTVSIEDRRALTNLTVAGAAQVNEGASSDYTSTAFFADCGPLPSTENVTAAATWSLVGAAPAGTAIAAGVLTAGAVDSNTPVTVRAVYRFGGATLTSDRVVTIVDTRALTNLVSTGAVRVPECSSAAYTGTAYFVDFVAGGGAEQEAGRPATPRISAEAPAGGARSASLGALDLVQDVSTSATWRLVGAVPAGTTLAGRTLTAGAVVSNTTVVVVASYAYRGVVKTNVLAVLIEDGRALTNLVVSGAARVNEGASSDCTSTAFFADCGPLPLTENVTAAAAWSLVGAPPAGTTLAAGVLTAGAVASDTPVTIRAVYAYGGTTLTRDKVVTIVDTRALTNVVTRGAAALDEGTFAIYQATAYFSDFGSTRLAETVTAASVWSMPGGAPAGTTLTGGSLLAGAVTAGVPITVRAAYAFRGVTRAGSLPVVIADTRRLTNVVCAGSAALSECSSASYTGTAHFADFGTLDLSRDVSASGVWNLSGPVPGGTGLNGRTLTAGDVAADAVVTVGVRYAYRGVTRTGTLAVAILDTRALTNLTVTGASSLPAGASAAYTGTAQFVDCAVAGRTRDVTADAAWSLIGRPASDTRLDGNVLRAGQPPTNAVVWVRAEYAYRGVTRSATKPVAILVSTHRRELTNLVCYGQNWLPEGASAYYTAVAWFDDSAGTGLVQDVSIPATWRVLGPAPEGTVMNGNRLTAGDVASNRVVWIEAEYSYAGVTKRASLPVWILTRELENVTATLMFASAGQWRLSRQTGTFWGAVRIHNPTSRRIRLTKDFALSIRSIDGFRFMAPDGRLANGDGYMDITRLMYQALDQVGNFDHVLDPGEGVDVTGIEVFSPRRVHPADALFDIWANVY